MKKLLLLMLLVVPASGFAKVNVANKNAPANHIGVRLGVGLTRCNAAETRVSLTLVSVKG